MPTYFRQQKPPFGSLRKDPHWSTEGLEFYSQFRPARKLVDFTQNKNDGVITGATWVAEGLDFSDDDVNLGSNLYDSIATTQEMTLIFRIYNQAGASNYARLIDKYPGPSIYLFDVAATAQISLFALIGGVSIDKQWTTAIINDNTWYTVAVVLSSGRQACYIDGMLADEVVGTGPYAGVYVTGTGIDAVLGNRASDLARDFDGIISHASIYNRALHASEIQQLYQNPNLPIQQDLSWMGKAPAAGPVTTTGWWGWGWW